MGGSKADSSTDLNVADLIDQKLTAAVIAPYDDVDGLFVRRAVHHSQLSTKIDRRDDSVRGG